MAYLAGEVRVLARRGALVRVVDGSGPIALTIRRTGAVSRLRIASTAPTFSMR